MIASFYVTFPDAEVAQKVSTALLEEKLVACANIIPAVSSLYLWEGKLNRENETLVFYKTSLGLADAARARLKVLHPYECPCILMSEMKATPEYFDWIQQELTKKASV